MAIDLNHLQYGAQFNAFVDFAATQRNPETDVSDILFPKKPEAKVSPSTAKP